MAMKGYPYSPELHWLEPCHQIAWCHIYKTHWGSFTHLQRCSRCTAPANRAKTQKDLNNNNHHCVEQPARISPTLSCYPSLSSIAPERSSGLYPVPAHSCCIYVLAVCPPFARPCEGVHRSMSLISSSLLLQLCPTCLVHLIWIFFVIGGRWLYSSCFVGCCIQDLSNIARSILV